jgi:ketosteroid isomerase-like protein
VSKASIPVCLLLKEDTLRIFISLVMISGLSLFAVAQTTKQKPSTAPDEQEVSAAVAKWLASSQEGDFTALRKLVADDFIGTTFSGEVVSKDDVAPQGGGGSFPEGAVQDLHVRVYGDTAVAIGAIVFKSKQPGTLRFTEVWAKRQAGWQMVAAHLSRVS